jgi:DNA-binding MurR/RpiR family transcriptional regulator
VAEVDARGHAARRVKKVRMRVRMSRQGLKGTIRMAISNGGGRRAGIAVVQVARQRGGVVVVLA